jgi:hypothetical protein
MVVGELSALPVMVDSSDAIDTRATAATLNPHTSP